MSLTTSNSEEPLTVLDFSNIYNKWLEELVSIEKNLIAKADDVRLLETTLNEDANDIKRLNEMIISQQVEQDYLETRLQSLVKEQEELQREIDKLQDADRASSQDTCDELAEEFPTIIETIETQIDDLRNTVTEIVNNLNTKVVDCEDANTVFSKYRKIMDCYTEALEILENNTFEIQKKIDKLNTLCLPDFIPLELRSPIL